MKSPRTASGGRPRHRGPRLWRTARPAMLTELETAFTSVSRPSHMDQPVIVKYRWTDEELIQSYRYHFRHLCRPAFRLGLNLIFAFNVLAGCILIPPGRSPFLGIVLLVSGLYWFAILPFERPWTIRRRFAKRPDRIWSWSGRLRRRGWPSEARLTRQTSRGS